MIIDSTKKKIINIINSRECEDVTNELNKYPNIEFASRDGSWSYNKAINDSKATIKQITDRFHLLKNMADKCCDIVSSIITGHIAVTSKESNIVDLAEYLLLDRHDRILLVRKNIIVD